MDCEDNYLGNNPMIDYEWFKKDASYALLMEPYRIYRETKNFESQDIDDSLRQSEESGVNPEIIQARKMIRRRKENREAIGFLLKVPLLIILTPVVMILEWIEKKEEDLIS